jgi:LysR family transcriptional regulator for metE and metH
MEPNHIVAGLELRHLRLVVQIVAHGSVTAAARALQLTQPALSHQLREIESRIRTPLFIRTSKRMIATAAGDEVARVGRQILAEMNQLEAQLAGGAFSEAVGTIRLTTACYTCYHWLPALLKSFRDRWRGIDVQIVPEHTGAAIAGLKAGALDIAVVHRREDDRRVKYSALFDDEMVVVVPPNHALATRPFVRAEDFASEHLILYTTPHSESMVLSDVLRPANVTPQRLTRIQLTEAIVELIKADLGVGVLARWAVAPQVRAGSLVAIPLTDKGVRRRWYAATRAADPEPAFQRDLLELLRAHLTGGPVVDGVQRIA